MSQSYFDYDDEYYEDDYPEERVTDEDVWYALTDGAEGDYPGPGWDPEWFGF